jgi:hypothetical protein
MTAIRDARESDIPAMLAMAERFIGAAWRRVGIPYDAETCETLLRGMIASETAILLVADDRSAMLGAFVYPWHFNRNFITGQELFWWAEPGSKAGIALLDEAERQAREMGATTFNMATIDHMRGDALDRLYRARGYTPSEHIFIRGLA